jgi:HEAT repeat protein
MTEVVVTVTGAGEAYVALVAGATPEVRTSVALDGLEEADAVPALERIVLDFDHYGRLVGLRVTGSADSVLAPSLLSAPDGGER